MTPKKIFIYLASKSARRRDYLKKMGIPFCIVPSTYQERPDRHTQPDRLVILHALGKAKAARLPRGNRPGQIELILGADTIVYFRGRVFGKPKNLNEAKEFLRQMSGKTHRVYSGIALISRADGKIRTAYAKTKVLFRKLTETEIRNYVRRVSPFDKAGAYAIQKKPNIVKSFDGSRSNVVGLPVEIFKTVIRKFLTAKQRPATA